MIQRTITLYSFSELSEKAQDKAVKQAINEGWFDDNAQFACEDFASDLRLRLKAIASIESIEYSIGFSKSDFFRIKFNRIQWKKGAKASLDYAPNFIVDFFDNIRVEFKKLVYLYKYTPNNYDEFVHINTGMGYYFPDSVAAIKSAIKQLEKGCYYYLRDTILEYAEEKNIRQFLLDDDCRLYTIDGGFYNAL